MEHHLASCENAIHRALSKIHCDVGAAFMWQLEGRGPLPDAECDCASRAIEKANDLITRLETIAMRGDFPSSIISHNACSDILTAARNVLRLSRLGYKKETLATWYSLKKQTIDRAGFWSEAIALGGEIDTYMRDTA
jgi:hypothetical protein